MLSLSEIEARFMGILPGFLSKILNRHSDDISALDVLQNCLNQPSVLAPAHHAVFHNSLAYDTAGIARLNDSFRHNVPVASIDFGDEVAAMPTEAISRIVDFARHAPSTSASPYLDERNFGRFMLNECEFVWCIDYFDASNPHAGYPENPANPVGTLRVFSILSSREYGI